MKKFLFNTGVKPWNTDMKRQIEGGNEFINNEMHVPFYVPDSVPDKSRLVCLCDNPHEHYSEKYFIIAEVLGGKMHSKYAIFHKSNS